MRGFSIILSTLFLLCFSGCSAMYVDPGPTPAHLRVTAQASLTPQEVDSFLESILGPVLLHNARWRGTLQGPWWGIKAYAYTPKGDLQQLQPVQGGIFEPQVTYNFVGSRDFVIPSGQYRVEVWLEAYMYYCVDLLQSECGTPTVRIWRQRVDASQFAPGQAVEAVINGN